MLGKVDNQLLIQVTLPADNQQKAQTTAENIINTLVIRNLYDDDAASAVQTEAVLSAGQQ